MHARDADRPPLARSPRVHRGVRVAQAQRHCPHQPARGGFCPFPPRPRCTAPVHIHPRQERPMTSTASPEVEGLFTSAADGVRLVAGRCAECETYFFPSHAALHRPNCTGGPVETATLSRYGTLVSYTIQRYAPPPPFIAPDPYEPRPMCTVAFPDGLQVPGMLTCLGIDRLPV